jgi:hypothetical protein
MNVCTILSGRSARFAAAAVLLGLAPLQAHAQQRPETPMAACAKTDVDLPPFLAGWTNKAGVVSATSAARAGRAMLTPGAAAQVSLHSVGEVAYPSPPGKPGAPDAYGGLVQFRVERAGTWRVALSSSAWIDVISGDQVEVSVAHAHGPACSTIRKTVDFSLKPGLYTLELSAGAEPEVRVLVGQVP